MLSEQHKAQHVRDRELLQGPLTEREAQIADAARRLAFDHAGDWLSQKEAKCRQFPGADVEAATARAGAYQNAAQEIYGWAISDR